MSLSSSTYRCDSGKWVTSACYAGVRSELGISKLEAPFVYFVSDGLTKEMCDWWYDDFIASCAPEETKEFWKYTDVKYNPSNNGEWYKTLEIDLFKMTWDDAIILLTMCRMIQEFPECVKLAHEVYHKYKNVVTMDTAVYFGLTYPSNTNSNHMPTGSGLHTLSWIDPLILEYSFKQRWQKYGGIEKKLISKNKGNNVNNTFYLKPRGASFDRAKYKLEFFDYLDRKKCLKT